MAAEKRHPAGKFFATDLQIRPLAARRRAEHAAAQQADVAPEKHLRVIRILVDGAAHEVRFLVPNQRRIEADGLARGPAESLHDMRVDGVAMTVGAEILQAGDAIRGRL